MLCTRTAIPLRSMAAGDAERLCATIDLLSLLATSGGLV